MYNDLNNSLIKCLKSMWLVLQHPMESFAIAITLWLSSKISTDFDVNS